MKRLLVLALLALGLTIVVAPTATPARPNDADAQGPPCAEITSGDGGYSSGGLIDFTAFLGDPACSFVTYTFVVTNTEGDTIASVSPDAEVCTPETPDGGCVHFSVNLGESGPSTVCVYATTTIGGHLVDRAPNVSDPTCPPSSPSISLVKGGSGASGGFG
jgi:hypothetical protein